MEPIHRTLPTPDANCPDFPGACECPRRVTVRHGYLQGEEFEIEARTIHMRDGSDDLTDLATRGNIAALNAIPHYGPADAPFYYGKIDNLGYVVSHGDIYDRIRHSESTTASGAAIVHLEPGHNVVCDDCGRDFTDLPDRGGLLFQSSAIGPCCAPKWEQSAMSLNESHFIRARCPASKSFADWVREDLR